MECTPAFERLAVLVASGQDHGAKGNGADFGELPEALDKLLKAEPELRDKWESGEKLIEGKDNSRSAFDFTLTVWLARHGYDDETIELALRHYPHGQLHELDGKAAKRRLARLLREAKKARRPAPTLGDAPFDTAHDGLALAMGEEWPDARHVAGWGNGCSMTATAGSGTRSCST